MANGPGFGGIAARTLAALVLVFATYNPERVSYFHWALAPLRTGEPTSGPASLKFLAGLALLGGWGIFLNATRRSIGMGGALLVLALSGGLVWLLIDFGIVSATSSRGITYVVLVCTALLLAVGMSWSHLSRRLSGQVDMDATD
ncbi:DUF6524 family protein [Gemmatimonas sp.]|jgi:hypothetical protein|uniref:DUF6524 family protein n=1 Tax=Gemmatimonas sp. TaxID=1962908 RepID=UPI0022BD2A3F|nr:DUF6524 family protein [Gemmatimonas sp.]MCZ8206425.1 DUF6524 family protein [Gemmatimonas sp.]